MWAALRGKKQLKVVFWLYCAMGGITAAVLPFALAEPLYRIGFPLWSFTLLAGLQLLYLLWAHISVWMCAFNSSRRVWGYLARAYVSAVVIVAALVPPLTTQIETRKIVNAQQAHARDVRNARA